MKCPHCLVEYHDHPQETPITQDADHWWFCVHRTCSSCNKVNLHLQARARENPHATPPAWERMVYPKGSGRPPCPVEVPADLSEDYTEACLVLPDSPKAAAALGRRCLQLLLRDHAGVHAKRSLADEIQHVLDNDIVPSHLQDAIDSVRIHGNFAAHPTKSKNTGEILGVEPGEAQAALDALEGLFDFFFVAPEKSRKRREELDKKLAKAGKPPSKAPKTPSGPSGSGAGASPR